ncbi:hypothetical protein JZ751_029847 [Albula glossodonta]|uniref:Uncharacterized protein n=1 Tax=Albula glossodonta TaxID=121402 RepID=A0A8T2N9U1_9TELE|nr:hypothetical protein JZ751_029847 [Albula glossodonta]
MTQLNPLMRGHLLLTWRGGGRPERHVQLKRSSVIGSDSADDSSPYLPMQRCPGHVSVVIYALFSYPGVEETNKLLDREGDMTDRSDRRKAKGALFSEKQ